jgi:hypothetical protein
MNLPLWLALGDAAVGAYLVVYAVRRERRDKPAVVVTGVVLVLCAAALTWLGLADGFHLEEPGRLPPPVGDLV